MVETMLRITDLDAVEARKMLATTTSPFIKTLLEKRLATLLAGVPPARYEEAPPNRSGTRGRPRLIDEPARLVLVLPRALREEAKRRARAEGLPLQRWLREVITAAVNK